MKFTAASGEAEFVAETSAQDKMEVQFASTLFALADNELLDFPFVKDGKPNCALVVSPNATEIERLMAWRVQEYFRYWYGRVTKPEATVVIPIQEAGKPVEGRAVVLRIAKGQAPRVALEGERLVIEAPDDGQLKFAVFKTLRALDRKYWTADFLIPTVLNEKMGLAGTEMP
jgi:hypothetical protein